MKPLLSDDSLLCFNVLFQQDSYFSSALDFCITTSKDSKGAGELEIKPFNS